MLNRDITIAILDKAAKFPVITLTGVRQCGKSTLLKQCFANYTYVSLEDPDVRTIAQEDPRGFLKNYGTNVIIDEAQRVPELFSYIQTAVDSNSKCGQYILSGSHNFLLMEQISQSLAGRACILELAPFSIGELSKSNVRPQTLNEYLLKGSYPRLYDKKISSKEYFSSYTRTYVERDVRLLRNISNAAAFTRFLKLCASRVGSVLNIAELAQDAGINVATANAWISILEASFIVFKLQPYYRNFSKRLIKSPKLYFYDTGLLCYLLNIFNEKQLTQCGIKGNIFESMIIAECLKQHRFAGIEPQAYFWRDSNQQEVDLLIENEDGLWAYEIKSGETMNSKFYDSLNKFANLSGIESTHTSVVYGGDKMFRGEKANYIPWDKVQFV
ncbi:ATP-binding protein [Fibrobacter sp. UWEL]|uniref:ATP-binding protein n=1 Tax=Fibrobacter sp. UWEL TaxID=1896209 RepID=UPI000923011C|nr:ATP-binding protein [Fibrobacter sp. UWEL]SHL01729.1 hypothetical protein SAMN05720468_11193 [Fibrobacter sp. UWEL]